MNVNKFKIIIYINEIAFFFGWVIIFLLGADKPPPIGFIWLVLLTAFLDVIQYFYLKKFLPNLNDKSKRLFIKNILFSILAETGVNILTVLPNLNRFLLTGIKIGKCKKCDKVNLLKLGKIMSRSALPLLAVLF